jgi:NAD(P)-dependent dehydrogenase (short-subunit alcohol dehydrogenase family)
MRVVVTGANRGIGLEFVKQLAARGDEVVATARRPEAADALNALAADSGGEVTVTQLDVTDAGSLAAFVGGLGAVDLLINNAGVYPRSGGIGELDFDAVAKGFEVNAIAPLRLVDAMLGALREGSEAKIVNVSSQMGSIADNSSGGAYAYRASKAALNMLTRSLAHDLRAEGISAAVIHPGWVQTDMGGPNAKITTEQSVAGMLEQIDALSTENSGSFLNWDGNDLPW